MPTVLVISPHADDAAAFCGGTIAKFADRGWQVILARVTDDAKDSVGLTAEEAIARNTAELAEAAKILGVDQIVELGFPTDVLADVPMLDLRERFVYLFRKFRPYSVLSFDPFGQLEDNMDHVRIAQAVSEAFWVSRFDLHYPEHQSEGLAPFAVCEQWYFGRHLPDADHVEEISSTIDRKIAAMAAHRTMVDHMIHQLQMQLETWGRRVPMLDEARSGATVPLLTAFFGNQASEVAQRFGLPAGTLAECFRLVRFGGLEEMFQSLSEPIPGVAPGSLHPGLTPFHPSE